MQAYVCNVPLSPHKDVRWLQQYKYREYVHCVLAHLDTGVQIAVSYLICWHDFGAAEFNRQYKMSVHVMLASWLGELLVTVYMFWLTRSARTSTSAIDPLADGAGSIHASAARPDGLAWRGIGDVLSGIATR